MKQTWKDYEDTPGPLSLGFTAIVAIAILCAAIWGISIFFRGAAETADVAQEQFGARALLHKYEWFKDASAALDRKRADIEVYRKRMDDLKASNDGQPRSKWAREDREQSNLWSSELAGIKASYNQLAAEYNSEMAKFNWRFANRGELPQGAGNPLPREYKPYETE